MPDRTPRLQSEVVYHLRGCAIVSTLSEAISPGDHLSDGGLMIRGAAPREPASLSDSQILEHLLADVVARTQMAEHLNLLTERDPSHYEQMLRAAFRRRGGFGYSSREGGRPGYNLESGV
jgi:hypothetical protein